MLIFKYFSPCAERRALRRCPAPTTSTCTRTALSFLLLCVVAIASVAFAEKQSNTQRRSDSISSETCGDRAKVLLKHIVRSTEELVGLLQDETENRHGDSMPSKVHSDELLVFSKALTFREAYDIVKPWTMVGFDYQEIMYNEISRLNANNVSGAVVECGVWAGGSTMMMMYSQIRSGSTQRHFWLYDTFEGHVAPDVTKDDENHYNTWKAVTQPDETTSAPDLGIRAVDNK